MRVAKIVIEAPVTSFRYPHFLIARQISFDMPPPSTIYGHVASAVGDLIAPDSFRFGYHFEFQSRASDLEHQHIISRPAGLRPTFTLEEVKHPVSVDVVVQPHLRDFLFKPRLTLYLDPPDLASAFRSPVFCVVLGRSQDLANVASVDEIDLEPADGAYLEHTLLPFSFRPFAPFGVTVLMPRYIEPPPERRAHFDRFICLHDRLFGGSVDNLENLNSRRLIEQSGAKTQWWVDPSTPNYHGVHRSVIFHSCAAI
jgi:CRISPR-associated protein Cas5t